MIQIIQVTATDRRIQARQLVALGQGGVDQAAAAKDRDVLAGRPDQQVTRWQ